MSDILDGKYKISQWSLFYPRTKKKLANQYPELRDEPRIKELSRREQIFCWLLGCKLSPLYDYFNGDDKKKVKKSVKVAIRESELRLKGEDDWINAVNDQKFPSYLHAGVKAFEKYIPGKRLQAMRMMEKSLDNYKEILDVNLSDKQFLGADGERDHKKVKEYAETSLRINKELKTLVVQMENDFAMSIKDEEEIASEVSLIDQIHENED